jgi:hypothetical protein
MRTVVLFLAVAASSHLVAPSVTQPDRRAQQGPAVSAPTESTVSTIGQCAHVCPLTGRCLDRK